MTLNKFIFILFITFTSFCLFASEEIPQVKVKGIKIDLKDPVYENGSLYTDQGGVITADGFRLQAQIIHYSDCNGTILVKAEKELLLEVGPYLFLGDKIEYNFSTHTGIITNGRTGIEPWYFGGEEVEICSNGDYIFHQAFITTSEGIYKDWEIKADFAQVTSYGLVRTKDVTFNFFGKTIFWLPKFEINLNSVFDSPINYDIQWGGRRSMVGLIYEFISWDRFRSLVRLDYHLKRGFGGGLETHYRSFNNKTFFSTINYYAKDRSLTYPIAKHRYRFQGVYHTSIDHDTITADLTYDKLSDIDMVTDYTDRGLNLEPAGKTQVLVRKLNPWWRANFFSKLRVNNFQTVKQELPSLAISVKPFVMGHSGILFENYLKTSYLDFAYSRQSYNVRDFNSSRYEYQNRTYRPFDFYNLKLTPEIGAVIIHYGNSPNKNPKELVIGNFSLEANSFFHKYIGSYKHIIKPYARYDYFTYPTVRPNRHFIFDIDDGWYRLNQLKLGFLQSFFVKESRGCIQRILTADIYSYGFFDTPTVHAIFPKIYCDLYWLTLPTLRHCFQTAWDLRYQMVDHFNFRTEWTISRSSALSAEYRHRDKYDWRKAVKYNFILDSFRSVRELEHSSVSDQRDTLLLHFFHRFHPNWAVEFESRHGWNRRYEPSYNEYEIDFITTLQSSWHFKFSYQKREIDHRFAVYFSIGIKRPTLDDPYPMCVSF